MQARLNRFIDMESTAIAGALDWLEREGFAKVLAAPGFVTIFFGVNLNDGKGVGVTFWDSAAAMRFGETLEAPVRDEALRLARADRSKGISETHEVALSDRRPVGPGPVTARLTRWEGVRPELIRHALDEFVEHYLDELRELPGYRGMFLGADTILGNAIGVSLWQDQDLAVVARVEGQISLRFEDSPLGPLRPMIVDTYDVAVLPELPQLLAHL